MSGNRGPNRSSFVADQRILPGQVDVIVDHHQRALGKAGVHAAGGVGQDQRLDAEQPERADRKGDAARIVPFVEMAAAGQRRDRLAARASDDQLAGVADDPRRRPVRQLAVRHRDRVARANRRSRPARIRARSRSGISARARDRVGRFLHLIVVTSRHCSCRMAGLQKGRSRPSPSVLQVCIRLCNVKAGTRRSSPS